MSLITDGIEELGAAAKRALDQRDAARGEADALRELAATVGAIACEAIVERNELRVFMIKAVQELDSVPNDGSPAASWVGQFRIRLAALLLRGG